MAGDVDGQAEWLCRQSPPGHHSAASVVRRQLDGRGAASQCVHVGTVDETAEGVALCLLHVRRLSRCRRSPRCRRLQRVRCRTAVLSVPTSGRCCPAHCDRLHLAHWLCLCSPVAPSPTATEGSRRLEGARPPTRHDDRHHPYPRLHPRHAPRPLHPQTAAEEREDAPPAAPRVRMLPRAVHCCRYLELYACDFIHCYAATYNVSQLGLKTNSFKLFCVDQI